MKFAMRLARLCAAAGLSICLLAAGTAAARAQDTKQDKAPAAAQEKAPSTAPYKDPSLPIEDRVRDLLARMTLEDKIEQIAGGWENQIHVIDPTGAFTDESARKTINAEWGEALKFTPRKSAILRNAVQRYQREKTRLGIPVSFFSEGLHGVMEYGSTSFPQALGLASTWDPALVKRVFTAVGDEAGSRGLGQVFTPVLDIARDPRWGRTEETYGEDPYLAARMGVAAVTGLQGDDFLVGRHHVLATAKHFAVHGMPEGGTNAAPGNYSERIIRENFLVPFEAAVREGRVGSVMASYNEIDGIPSHINHWLLDRVLRQEWGFNGYITSDGGGIQMLTYTHHVAYNSSDAARQALAAGVDYDLSDGAPYRTLLDQVKRGIVPASEVDQAAARVLRAKFRLGLFDNPFVDADYAEKTVNGPEHRALAREAAEKVLVLLKNDKNLLPLDLTKLKTIAVVGPNAADVHVGGYARDPVVGVSILDGIKARVAGKAQVLYAKGCKITDAPEGWAGWNADNVKLFAPETQKDAIAEAVAAAKKADVAIVVVGENESTNREAWSEEHRGDRDSLDLLGAQNELVRQVVETGKPVVVILINGRPLSVNYIAEKVPAILEGWYLGEEGGTAAAEVLFGDVNPGGKLPITFPHSVGDLPDFYNHKPSDNRGYEFSTREPLYPFGFGLSYTSFKFENLKVSPAEIRQGGTARLTVDVTNTGTRAGDEVAQFYVHQKVASVTRPVEQLRGFERVTLKPGEKRTVEFTVTPEALEMLDVDMHKVVEPGVFELMVGGSSDKTQTVKLTVLGTRGETGKPPLPPPPAGSESGVVSTFDDGKVAANFGSWLGGGDAMEGGKSTAALTVVEPGAAGSKGAMQVAGEVVAGRPMPYAGALYFPAPAMGQSANLSAKKEIRFWAKGDGGSYTLAVMTESAAGNGGMPASTQFVAGPEWKQYVFPFSTFDTDGSDLIVLAFLRAMQPGKFSFELDQVEFR
ncbi:MAG: glycoside hydrolase family 3 N-terminal domain-containing protein [Terracidiphilus sp.]